MLEPPGLALDECAAHLVDELALAERLEDDVRRAGSGRAALTVDVAPARNGDDRHLTLAADATCRLDAVELREAEVEQDHVRPMLSRLLDGLDPVAGLGDVEAGVLEDQPQVGPHDRVVLDGENSCCCNLGHHSNSSPKNTKGPGRLSETSAGRYGRRLRRSASS